MQTDEILQENIVIQAAGGGSAMGAYMARPATGGKYPAVIVGMELFGVTAHIRNIVNRVAALGYLVIAPDFYHRVEPNAELTYDQSGRAKGFELLRQVSRKDVLDDVRSTMDFLRAHPESSGRLGFLGFSVGGHIGYLAATQMNLAACVVFYPGWLANTDIGLSQPEPTLTMTSGIARHGGAVLFFVGENDFLIKAKDREEIAAALAETNVRHEIVVYPEVQHGFFCDERESFNQQARDDAWERTQHFLSELLNDT